MQQTDKAIAEFEAWWIRQPHREQFEDVKDQMRNVWVASRKELVIDLPQTVGFEGAYDSMRSTEFSDHAGELVDADEVFSLCRRVEVREAIQAAGVTVRG